MLKNILVLLHVITAAGWFGLALSIGGMARKAAAAAGAGAPLLEEGSKTIKLMGIFIVLTFVFGLLAFFLGGGFGGYGPQYHTSLSLIVILIGIQFAVIAPSWRKLAAGDASASSARKRIGMGVGIGHLLWLVTLILMFWNHFPLMQR